MPRILLLNDNGDQDNWGAQATPYAIKRMLRDHIPGVEIQSIAYGAMTRRFFRPRFRAMGERYYLISSADRFRVPKFMLSRAVEFFPPIVDDFDYFADLWERGRGGPLADEFISAARRADIVLFNAENSIYRNAITGVRGLFMTWYARKRLGKRAGVINQTARVSDMDRPIMRGMVKMAYPELNLVTAREVWSYRDLMAAGVENAEHVPDVVFYLREDEWNLQRERFGNWKRAVGLADGEPYYCLSASSLPMGHRRPGHGSPVAELVRKINTREPRAVIMARDSGCLFLEDVAKETDSIFFGPEHSFHELWPLFEGARFLVTGHLHYVIMASQVGCPCVPMSTNNHKIQGVLDDLGLPTHTFDATALRYEVDEVVEAVDDVIDRHDRLSEALVAASERLGAQAARNATLVRDILARGNRATAQGGVS